MLTQVIATGTDVAGSGFDPLTLVSTLFMPAALVGFILKKVFVPGWALKRSEEERAQLQAMLDAERIEYRRIIEAKDGQLSTLNAAMSDKVVPALERSTWTVERLVGRSSGGA